MSKVYFWYCCTFIPRRLHPPYAAAPARSGDFPSGRSLCACGFPPWDCSKVLPSCSGAPYLCLRVLERPAHLLVATRCPYDVKPAADQHGVPRAQTCSIPSVNLRRGVARPWLSCALTVGLNSRDLNFWPRIAQLPSVCSSSLFLWLAQSCLFLLPRY